MGQGIYLYISWVVEVTSDPDTFLLEVSGSGASPRSRDSGKMPLRHLSEIRHLLDTLNVLQPIEYKDLTALLVAYGQMYNVSKYV